MKTICSVLSNVCCQNSEPHGNVGESSKGSPNVPTFEEKLPDENEVEHHHLAPDNSMTRKFTAERTSHFGSCKSDHENIHLVNVEESVAYFFLILLLIFYVFLWIRCIRIALDPYNSAETGEQWMESASKDKIKAPPELQFQASLRKRKSTVSNPFPRSCEHRRYSMKAKSI